MPPVTTHKYIALEVIQQPDSPPFYITAGSARELLTWCDIPRAKADYMAGYQRALDTGRSSSLTEYLRLSPSNIVPGAIIVAVDSDYVEVNAIGDIREILVKEDDRDFQTKLQELFGSFTTRLSSEELESADIEFSEAGWSDDDDEDDDGYPSSYLAMLAKELHAAIEDWDSLDRERQDAINSYIDGVSKPGLIIDGQHRVNGAAGLKSEVQLPIVLVPGLKYAEQVFQFYVLNSKAKPLRPTELRRIVSTSLTNEEIQELFSRFRQAGVDPAEARWTHEMNTRPDSPFFHRIDFGYELKGAVIKENVADQVARAFMKMPPRRYKQLIKPLGDDWKQLDRRLETFFWFWKAVKEQYAVAWAAAEMAADGGDQHNLFMKVSLLTLQKFLLDRFVTALPYRDKDAPPPLSSEEEVRKMVASTLEFLPGKFFERKWELKQIDTTEGRKDLYKAMEQVHSNQGKIHGNMKLFKSGGG